MSLTTDLGACEWFVWDLRRSNLLDRGQLDQVIGEFLNKNPGAEPPTLAEFLVRQGILTDFQAERLLQGKTQGFVLGPFTLMDALGAGSMGTVYKAQSKTDNKWYAVKVLPRRSMWNVRIARRKVRLFEQCQHVSVVPFIDVGTAGGMHYLAWPLVEGKTLEKIVQEQTRLSAEQTATWALQTAEGLNQAHQANLFHGLLKPSNLMIAPDNQVRILDFGIGCLLAETEGESLVDTMSTANSVNSGLDCASPESIMDPTNLNALGDQYSLGCVIYFCLTGRYPFPDGTAVEKMMCHQLKQPTPIKQLNPDAPDDMIAIVERLMQKDPATRYASFSEVIEALRPLTQTGGAPQPQRRPTKTMPRVRLQRPAAEGLDNGHAAVPAAPAAPPAAPAAPPAAVKPPTPPPPPRPVAQPGQPLPPRAPSAAVGTGPGKAPAPRLPRPGDLPRSGEPNRRPVEQAPPPAPVVVKATPPVAQEAELELEPLPRDSAGVKFGPVAVILVSLVAGVAAFFLSRLIPF
jgi:serine/threonine-protein kinase